MKPDCQQYGCRFRCVMLGVANEPLAWSRDEELSGNLHISFSRFPDIFSSGWFSQTLESSSLPLVVNVLKLKYPFHKSTVNHYKSLYWLKSSVYFYFLSCTNTQCWLDKMPSVQTITSQYHHFPKHHPMTSVMLHFFHFLLLCQPGTNLYLFFLLFYQ